MEKIHKIASLYNIDANDGYPIERTLAIIKPDGMLNREKIVNRIENAGFKILQTRIVKLTAEQASEFYKSKYGLPEYPLIVIALTEGPIQAMCIAKQDAVKSWNVLMGPENYLEAKKISPWSIRAEFAYPAEQLNNAVHGSENLDLARFEIYFFFPNMILEPILDETSINKYLQVKINPFMMDGLYELTKLRPEEPIIWLSNWLIQHNPYKPITTYAKLDESKSQDICPCHIPVYSDGLMKCSRCKSCIDYDYDEAVTTMNLADNSKSSSCICSSNSSRTLSSGTVESLFESDNCSCHSFVSLSEGLEKIVHCPVCNKSIIIKLNLLRKKEDSKISGKNLSYKKSSEISSSSDSCELDVNDCEC